MSKNTQPEEPEALDILAHHMAETAAVVIYRELKRLFAIMDDKAKQRENPTP